MIDQSVLCDESAAVLSQRDQVTSSTSLLLRRTVASRDFSLPIKLGQAS